MSDCQELVELLHDGVVSFTCSLQQLIEVVQGLSQGLNFLMFTFDKDLHGDHFVGGEVLWVELHAVVGVGLCSGCEVASFDCDFDVLI